MVSQLRVVLALLGAGGIGACDSGPPPPCPDCNVVLITIDTLRADHVSAYGYARETTPRIDAFFAQGTRYRQAATASPCTLPAVRQLLTGRIVPAPAHPRIAEVLRDAGWDTAAIVSHHFFRDREGPLPEYARGFDEFDVQEAPSTGSFEITRRTATEVTNRALAWLEARASDEPFFLWLHYFDPHDPYTAPEDHRVFDPRTSTTIDGDRRVPMRAARELGGTWESRGAIFDPEEVRFLVAQYDAEVRYVDAEIGRVFDTLAAQGRVDDSLVVLTSDHGERLGEDDWWDHCQSLHQREMRVPLLVRMQGRPLAGVTEARFAASTLDLLPTILGAVGLRVPADRPGRSLLSLAGEEAETPSGGRVVRTAWQGHRFALLPPWKLVIDEDGTRHLYDIETDPDEEDDRIGDASEVAAPLSDALEASEDDLDRASEASGEILSRLRALGYVE